MKRERISEMVEKDLIKGRFNNAQKTSFDQIADCEQYFFEDLPNTNVKGYPFASSYVNVNTNEPIEFTKLKYLSKDKRKEYKLKYYYLPTYHEICIGTTGSGKTTCNVEPQLRALASQKNKPNFFITDPKGELFFHHAKFLKERGYNVKIINFKDTSKSEKWNPLYEIARIKEKQIELKKGSPKLIKYNEDFDLRGREYYSNKSEFGKNDYYEYDNILFANLEDFETYKTTQVLTYELTISQKINEIAYQIMPDQPHSNDRSWSDGARNALIGAVKIFLESFEKKGKVDYNKFTIKAIYDLLDMMYLDNASDTSGLGKLKSLNDIKFIQDYSEESKNLLRTVFDAPDRTKLSYISVIASSKVNYLHPHLTQITSGNTLDDSLFDTNFAIFFATRDSSKSDFTIASLFINWVYSHMMEKADKVEKNKGLADVRATHFILDEFANIPKIPDFETKITVSRSRNIFVHLFIQSYSQIESVYNSANNTKIAETIFDNCNSHTYMGCQNIESVKKFAEQCGTTTAIKHKTEENDSSLEEGLVTNIKVIPESMLDSLQFGEFYIKRVKSPVIFSRHVPSFICSENGDYKDFSNAIDYSFYTFKKESLLPFNDKKFTISKEDFSSETAKENDDDDNEEFGDNHEPGWLRRLRGMPPKPLPPDVPDADDDDITDEDDDDDDDDDGETLEELIKQFIEGTDDDNNDGNDESNSGEEDNDKGYVDGEAIVEVRNRRKQNQEEMDAIKRQRAAAKLKEYFDDIEKTKQRDAGVWDETIRDVIPDKNIKVMFTAEEFKNGIEQLKDGSLNQDELSKLIVDFNKLSKAELVDKLIRYYLRKQD